jgi:peptidoglycan hydrolase CwlO-like protein
MSKKINLLFIVLLLSSISQASFSQVSQKSETTTVTTTTINNADIKLECPGYEKRIEELKSNIQILEQKISEEKLKGENLKQGVIDAAETKIKELNEQITYNQDILNVCNGKLNKPDPSKCTNFEKIIQNLNSNKQILEKRIAEEKAKGENAMPSVIDVAETNIKGLDEEIVRMQKALNTCIEVQDPLANK